MYCHTDSSFCSLFSTAYGRVVHGGCEVIARNTHRGKYTRPVEKVVIIECAVQRDTREHNLDCERP